MARGSLKVELISCRDLLKRENPGYVGEGFMGGCVGCPHNYGYLPQPVWCELPSMPTDEQCRKCWNRVMVHTALDIEDDKKTYIPVYAAEDGTISPTAVSIGKYLRGRMNDIYKPKVIRPIPKQINPQFNFYDPLQDDESVWPNLNPYITEEQRHRASFIYMMRQSIERNLLETMRNNVNVNDIQKVIFNDPATIVFWRDGSKTVVKAVNEKFDPEKGLAMAIVKHLCGDKGNYYNVFRKWTPKQNVNDKKEEAKIEVNTTKCDRPTPEDVQMAIEEINRVREGGHF